jgi:ATP-dependent helicase HrpB
LRINLPIDDALPQITAAVEKHPLTVVQAPAGSGKTTRVAVAIRRCPAIHRNNRIYLLQPRRLAARSVAQRIADENEWGLGKEIGYHVRFERAFQRDTSIIVATEGVLLRRLQDDATLQNVSVVILDEFHERSLDADLLLGMLRQLQSTLREDLKIVVMSATLNADELRLGLNDPPILSVEGRMYPVSIRYRPSKFRQTAIESMTDAVLESAQRDAGDILAFLPGQGEIHRVRNSLVSSLRDCEVHGLYGSLPLEEQTKIIQPGPKRKIVLATNVAETSLTIEGIRVVIDSGLARVMRFDPQIGLDRLNLESIAQDSATQRAGRAGRVAEGICYRLWSEAEQRSRPSTLDPEIRRIDLADAVLKLYHWGQSDILSFPWLTLPRPEAVSAAVELLRKIGAIDHERLTDIGKQLVRLPLHPRLGRMVLEGFRLGGLPRVAMTAALLAERDPFQKRNDQRSTSSRSGMATHQVKRWSSDIAVRVELLERFIATGDSETIFGSLNRGSVQSIVKAAKEIEQLARNNDGDWSDPSQREPSDGEGRSIEASPLPVSDPDEILMRALLAGFPDRVAKRRSSGSSAALMVGGKAVQLASDSGVHQHEYFLAIDVDAGGSSPNAGVRQASAVESSWLEGPLRRECDELFFHPSQQLVVARRRVYWADLLLNETPTSISDQQAAADLLFRSAIAAWDRVFPNDDEELNALIGRCRWLRSVAPEVDLPEIDEKALHSVCRELCNQCRSFSELKKAAWLDWLSAKFSAEQMRVLDREAPRRIQVPSGSSHRIEYEVGKTPILAVKIQEVFSWKSTPRLAFGRVSILLHLLAPNQRPTQITDDLASFWASGYALVKKDLKRRYPKHSWPDDPTTAEPSKR